MKKIVSFMHLSLDGFVAGPKGEMDWITVNEEMFDYAKDMIDQSDLALYGRVTFQMMEAYWPTAADQPNATKHDKEHSHWYNQVDKIVASKTLSKNKPRTRFISENLTSEILSIKHQSSSDKCMVIFGSPSMSHSLMEHDLIDEYWLFVNPILLGEGIPMFKNVLSRKRLNLLHSKIFSGGVVAMQYSLHK